MPHKGAASPQALFVLFLFPPYRDIKLFKSAQRWAMKLGKGLEKYKESLRCHGLLGSKKGRLTETSWSTTSSIVLGGFLTASRSCIQPADSAPRRDGKKSLLRCLTLPLGAIPVPQGLQITKPHAQPREAKLDQG